MNLIMKINFKFYIILLLCTFGWAQCPINTYSFQTQAQVNNFVNEYPNCEEGHVFTFIGNNITDLSPLSYIDRIAHIQIIDADNITSLMAFDGTQIIGTLYIENSDGLVNLNGIHFMHLQPNFWLHLKNNSLLENIDALDDFATNFATVTIMNNPNLSQCAVKRVCQSLLLNAASVSIENNGVGCNSVAQVDAVCQSMGIYDLDLNEEILIFPNPSSSRFELTTSPNIIIHEVIIYNQLGIKIITTQKSSIDISDLPNGLYFIDILSNKGKVIKKVIIQ